MYIMMMNWRGKKSKKSEKWKRIAAKYMKKHRSLVSGEFLQTSCCTCSSAAQWSSAPDRTAEWDLNCSWAILLASEKFLWFSSSIKGFIRMTLWRGGSSWQDYTKISIYPSFGMKKGQPGCPWMLWVTVPHGKMPNRTMDWANNNTTPLRMCLLGHLCRLASRSFILWIGFLQENKKLESSC